MQIVRECALFDSRRVGPRLSPVGVRGEEAGQLSDVAAGGVLGTAVEAGVPPFTVPAGRVAALPAGSEERPCCRRGS